MESAQYTGGSSPSTNNNTLTPRNNSTQPRQQRGSSQPPRRRRPSARPPLLSDSGDATSTTGGFERDGGSDVEELGRFLPTPPNHSRSSQSRSRSAGRPPSSNPRTAPASSVPSEDVQLVDPIPRRPPVPSRRSVPRGIPRLGGENGTSSAASDTDTTSSSSSSGPAPIRRRPLRTRTEGRLSLRGPILEQSREGNLVPPGVEYGPDYDGTRPLPPRTRNPRDILNDGERGFIVDLKMNLEIEIELKAAIMGDLTLSVL